LSKRAVLYARVSSDEQADKGYSLRSQLELCRKYAERLGFEIAGQMQEDYSGVVPIAERPQGKKLAAMLKLRQAEVVIVYQVDRLSRKLGNLLTSVEGWLEAGIELHSCDVGRISSSNDIVLVIKGWQGTDERDKIIERCSRGTYTKAREGKVVGAGRVLYGYHFFRDANNKVIDLNIYDLEARIVRLIYQWYVRGDENFGRMSMHTIVRRLSAMRVPTPGESRGYARKRESGLWTQCQVASILKNETYAGTWRFGKMKGHAGKGGKRQIADQIAIKVPAIIEHGLWEAAQSQRAHNEKMAKRNGKRDYLLRGRIRCGCGLAMGGKFTMNRYYQCTHRSHYLAGMDSRICNAKYLRADLIEAIVWDYVKDLFSDLEKFRRGLLLAQQAELEALTPKREELATVEKMIAQIEDEAANYARALATAQSKLLEHALERQANEIDARYNALIQRRDELKIDLEAQKFTDQAIIDALEFRERIVIGMEEATFADKREVLDRLGIEVIVKDGQARITCRIPTAAPNQLSIALFMV
jgi:site-specific DNA recombinase